jgi:hypothetical protein
LSPLVWFFLWLPEEVSALLFLLHRENRDFSILMKDMFSPFMDVCVTSHFKVIILIILIHSFVLVAGWILLVPENQASQIM